MFVVTFSLSAWTYPRYPKTPDVELTPGKLCSYSDPDFEYWRPAGNGNHYAYCERNVSWETKQYVYDLYGIPENDRRQYIIDHLIPLSVGGSNSISNLWPEHRSMTNKRMDFERILFENLRDGDHSQEDAVNKVLCEKFKDYYHCYHSNY